VITEVLDKGLVQGEDGRLAGFKKLVKCVQGCRGRIGKVSRLGLSVVYMLEDDLLRLKGLFSLIAPPKGTLRTHQEKHSALPPFPPFQVNSTLLADAHLPQAPFLVPKGSTHPSSLEIFQASPRGRIGMAPSVRAWCTGKRSTVGVSKASSSGSSLSSYRPHAHG
jgi:hypothetical protein